jgi:hypothetical protein
VIDPPRAARPDLYGTEHETDAALPGGRRLSRVLVGVFFFLFSLIETVLVLSIDGILYPFQWGDLLSALTIFTAMTMIFLTSFNDTGSRRRGDVDDSAEEEL